jgi:uncharacterized repeat protein (TIGR03803 family)
LNSGGLALAVNDSQVTVSSGATRIMLASAVPSGAAYTVKVTAQPTGATCSVTGGTGTATADVSNIAVSCSGNTYTISGSVAGLTTSGLVLLNNGADATTIAANATQFTMNTNVPYGGSYAITVQTQPLPRWCTVTGGSGNSVSGNITGVTIGCAPPVIYSFGNGSTDAAEPGGELLQDSDGNFYGTTVYGGANGAGAVFRITPAGVETVLYPFAGGPADGANPDHVRLIHGSDGSFYGTTSAGGANGKGTIFRLTPAGAETVLHSFAGAPGDGDSPLAGLLQGSDGNFYGTTVRGGANGLGSIFKLTPAGVETVLYSFAPGGDANSPDGTLIEGSDGSFYGVSSGGGTSGQGTTFKISPAGVETVLHSFLGAPGDGGLPYSVRLLEGSDGNFYGTTEHGGTNDLGTVFKMTPAGAATVLYSFSGGPGDGDDPGGNLVQGSDGSLYGTTAFGGATGTNVLFGAGTVFKLAPSGTESIVYSFTGRIVLPIGNSCDDGNEPYGLTVGADGNLYGTTSQCGINGQGTFFRVVPD